MMIKNILVTGGAGFIASQVAKRFIKEGCQVTIVDNLVTGDKKNVSPDAKFYQMDIGDPQLAQVFADGKFDAVDHHAAQIDVRKSVEDPAYDAKVNVLGSLNLLDCIQKYGVKKMVYASTGGAVYGEPQYLPADENHPVKPLCPYGITKHTVEHYIELYSMLYGLNYTILRYPNVYGTFQNPYGEAGVNAIFIGQMLTGKIPTIFGDGEQTRDFVFVADVVEANWLALNTEKTGIFNLGWAKPISVNDIYRTLQKITGITEPANYAEERAGEVNQIYLSAEKIKKELGWEPKVDFEEGLRRTTEWFKENPNWYTKPGK
jgi:UDP-glucose 4-epimerase